MFKKVTVILSKANLFTDREIGYLREGLEQLSTSYSANYYETEKHQLLTKIDFLSYAMENAKETDK